MPQMSHSTISLGNSESSFLHFMQIMSVVVSSTVRTRRKQWNGITATVSIHRRGVEQLKIYTQWDIFVEPTRKHRPSFQSFALKYQNDRLLTTENKAPKSKRHRLASASHCCHTLKIRILCLAQSYTTFTHISGLPL